MSVLDRTPPTADHRIPYGPGDRQFGDLFLPSSLKESPPAPLPLVVLLHGGWWRAEYDLSSISHLAAALKAEGLPVWSIEYRGVGAPGGGFPGTFHDAASGFDHIATLARSFPLDLAHVVTVGHSAGAHLAFWLAGRHHIDPASPLAEPQPRASIHSLVSLAGVVDLRLVADLAGYFTYAHDKGEVFRLMGGSPGQVPDRYRAGNPGDLLPLNVGQTLIQGSDDRQIPPTLPARWTDLARRQGDRVTVHMVGGADHFDVIDPLSPVWPLVRDTMKTACL